MLYEHQIISRGIDALMHLAHENAKEKGFYETFPALSVVLMNMHEELSEVWDAVRRGTEHEPCDKIPSFSNLEEELADLMIRVADTAESHKLDLAGAIMAKMEYNKGREHKHGKKV